MKSKEVRKTSREEEKEEISEKDIATQKVQAPKEKKEEKKQEKAPEEEEEEEEEEEDEEPEPDTQEAALLHFGEITESRRALPWDQKNKYEKISYYTDRIFIAFFLSFFTFVIVEFSYKMWFLATEGKTKSLFGDIVELLSWIYHGDDYGKKKTWFGDVLEFMYLMYTGDDRKIRDKRKTEL